MIQLKNNAQSMLAYPVGAADTLVPIIPEDMARFPALSVPGDHFYCAIADSQGNLEFVRVTRTDAEAATLTVERGGEGTAPRNWNTGDRIQLRMSMATWTDMAGDWWQRVKTAAGDALAPERVSSASFRLSGDWTGEMQEGRRLRVTASDGTRFKGHVASAAFAGGATTVTLGGNPAPALVEALAAVDMGFSLEMESQRAKDWADAALAAKVAAAASEGKAGASEQAAKLSENNAKASEAAAAASERAAKASETNAQSSESNALASRNAAAASESKSLEAATRAETAAEQAEVIAGGSFVPTTRNVFAGTGLSGGGDLTADRTFSVAFGTTKGTVCQGNDVRLTDARTPSAHAAKHNVGGSDQITVFGGNVAEKFQSLGSISGARTIDLTDGNVVIATIGGATTFSFTGLVSGMANTVLLKLTNAGSAAITWPAAVKWAGGAAPTLTAVGLDVIALETDDDGATWIGVLSGMDMQ